MRLPCSHKRECTGCSKNCEHGRRRYFCKDCGGNGICEHGRNKYTCKECGGSSICEHGRQRKTCKECGGSSLCEHGRLRNQCKECGGAGICEHGRRRYSCKECGGGGICEHGRRRGYCKECGVWSYESTSMEDLVGYSCGVCKVRECVCQPGGAELTRPPAGPGSTRGRASLDPRVARVRHSL